MRDLAARILFVPVSGPYGVGEYARSSAIARAVTARWPGTAVHFVLSRAAPYAADAEFAATWLDSSATFHSAAVIDLIEQWRPHIVVFDNAGRTVQLRAARRSGARVVYISARRRQRGKAFRLKWMRLIDEHWIAYPEFLAGKLDWLERAKLELLGRPRVRYLDVILSRAAPARAAQLLSRSGCVAGGYVLVVPGGGTGHPGVRGAAQEFLSAARTLAARGLVTLFAGPALADRTAAHAPVRLLGALPQADLAALMQSARLVLVNGGSTLVQAIACGAPCVAVPIARDQAERVRGCVRAGVAIEAALDAAAIAAAASALWDNEAARAALARRAAGLALADGIEVAVAALSPFIATA